MTKCCEKRKKTKLGVFSSLTEIKGFDWSKLPSSSQITNRSSLPPVSRPCRSLLMCWPACVVPYHLCVIVTGLVLPCVRGDSDDLQNDVRGTHEHEFQISLADTPCKAPGCMFLACLECPCAIYFSRTEALSFNMKEYK